MVERILKRWGDISPDAYPRCVFCARVVTGDSTMTFASIEQVDSMLLTTPRGAHIRGTEYFVCDDERFCDGRGLP
jgi:hypothetical protein